MPKRAYRRSLLQLILVPLVAITVLALGLAYALRQVNRSAAWVDHTDEVIGHANRLIRLIVGEEAAIRGYLLTRNAVFLSPYQRAEPLIPEEFATLADLIRDNPSQTASLNRWRQQHDRWQQATEQMLRSAPPAASLEQQMIQRKALMDDMRQESDRFLRVENELRGQRSTAAMRVNAKARFFYGILLCLIAGVVVWVTARNFQRLRSMFGAQLDEARAQHELALEREQWLNTTMRSIGDAVIACDPEGRVSFMNATAERLTGWREEEAKGRSLTEVFHILNEHTRQPVESPVEKVRRTGTVVGLANHTVLIRKNGEECSIDDSGAPIVGTDARMLGIVLVFRDISDRRSSEVALMRAEKLAAAGKLAASIAHEVNNPLEGLTNMLYLAREGTDLEEIQKWLAQAQSEVNRLSHITRQTLGFYRESGNPTLYRPSDVVEEVMEFYATQALSKNVRLQAEIRTQRSVYGIPGELRQVLSNLIANSLDAMAGQGVIRLVVRQASTLHNPPVPGIYIAVADTGSGIPKHILQHIFEPFFTTKVDTGTGLGLWVSKELVEKQGGRIRVRARASGAATGTVFSIALPMQQDAEAATVATEIEA